LEFNIPCQPKYMYGYIRDENIWRIPICGVTFSATLVRAIT